VVVVVVPEVTITKEFLAHVLGLHNHAVPQNASELGYPLHVAPVVQFVLVVVVYLACRGPFPLEY
jgi:hypothetical protein